MDTEEQKKDEHTHRQSGRIWAGLFLLIIGGIFIMKEASLVFFPHWLFTWPMILIAVGVFSAIKHGFRGGGWLVLLLVGGFFLTDELDPDFNFHRYIVPIIIICVGLTMLVRPRWRRFDNSWYRDQRREWRRERRDWHRQRWGRDWDPGNEHYGAKMQDPSQNPPPPPNFSSGPAPAPDERSTEDYLDSTSIFGNVRRVIMSKNFRGGEATSFMGGTELDFTQADINGTVVLELTQVMGGAKLIVPGHWLIRNEVNAVLGGVDDKRQLNTVADPTKVLVLKGTSFLGGLEIRNY